MSGAVPRRITTFQPVKPGTSGGISVRGSVAALAGSALIAVIGGIGWILDVIPTADPVPLLIALVAAGGFAGCLIDSLMGATVQASFRCSTCGATIENPTNGCHGQLEHVGGVRWIDNDVVNVLSVTAGAMIVALGVFLG